MTLMWEMDSMHKVHQFISTLSAQDAQDAHSLVQIAVWENAELEWGLDAYQDQAGSIIASVK